ncbi:MAG: condensation domain-containing protein, partial [Acidobacteriota bacterium]
TGEALPPGLCRRWFALYPHIPLVNAYGPTECSDDVSHAMIRSASEVGAPRVSIGRPVGNLRLAVLDRRFRAQPIGAVGELCVGGVGVGRGYLSDPQRTAEVFVPDPDPIRGTAGSRLYRTGDLARWLPGGNLDYLGRRDHQVKVRGVRIELGEIEAVLGEHPAVRAAVTLLRSAESRQDPGGEPRLVAYVVFQEGETPGIEALRGWLQERLPEPMVPATFVFLDALPLTPNGKIDRRALNRRDLPAAAVLAGRRATARTPVRSDPIEELLAGIWSEVLAVGEVGPDDNFFELGGHSLLITRVASRIRSVFGVELPIRRLFEQPTLAELAREIGTVRAASRATQVPPIVPRPRGETAQEGLALSFAQERLWFLDQLLPGSSAYNVPATVSLSGPLSVPALAASLNEVVRRHEVLRTRFVAAGGQPLQRIAPELRLEVPLVDLSGLAESTRWDAVDRLAAEAANRPFDLETGPLLRTTLLRLGAETPDRETPDRETSDWDEHVALFAMHHIVSDGWSMDILIAELASFYRAFQTGTAASLPEPAVQYADYAAWQRQWLAGEELERQLAVWRQRLGGAPAALELPTDRPYAELPSSRGGQVLVQLPRSLSDDVAALSRRHRLTLFMTLLAAFQTLLSRLSGQRDVVVGSPIAGRNRLETEGLIGFFVNTLVLRGDLSGDPPFQELLERTRQVTLEAYDHQDVPFEALVDTLAPERNLHHPPLFQVMLALENKAPGGSEMPGLAIHNLSQELTASKFDLTLSLTENDGGLTGFWSYKAELFDRATVRRYGRHLETLLGSLAADPEQRLSELPLLSATERQQLLVEWNDPRPDYPVAGLVHELIAVYAAREADTVAVVFEGETLTYGELDAQADLLARRLRKLGVGARRRTAEFLIGVCLERSLDLVVSLLAVLKSGGAYLPLDPSYPRERLAFMVQDAGVPIVLTKKPFLTLLPQEGPRLICVNREHLGSGANEWAPGRTAFATPVRQSVRPDNPAYVIYTSGSTGQPKGVMVSHRSLLNRVLY